ncbi:hypothetical protein [Thermomonospora umbrina]|uniref:Uncharacterized protein n=1 Tax=Thermomonospora umbrina TaxID=111806 RepID=A0A3D9SXS3_9ACTN|nr:hypothetical protein [Thermomonospora umbrina]REF00659.1 hypothetical protein DFJ69_6215 [Thermomonospora umbrina]
MTQVNKALREVWEESDELRPDRVLLRTGFLLAEGNERRPPAAPMVRLLNPRGVALRFYLLALFEAQCRLRPGQPWKNTRPISGRMGWRDLIAVDTAYDRQTGSYQRETKQRRDPDSCRDRQIQGALRSLGEGEEQALVTVPFKANGRHRDYGAFELMSESGRGGVPTPDHYTVPDPRPGVIGIPIEFFLHGWVQVLHPSEIATWLILRHLRWRHPQSHDRAGVFLYGQTREEIYHLRSDSYEDGCRTLLELGLIREARPMSPTGGHWPLDPAVFAPLPEVDEHGRVRYRPNRFQLLDDGLKRDALTTSLKEFTLRQKEQERKSP